MPKTLTCLNGRINGAAASRMKIHEAAAACCDAFNILPPERVW